MNLIAQKDFELRQLLSDILKEKEPNEKLIECENWDCILLELLQTGTIEYLFLDLNIMGISWKQRTKDLLTTLENTKLIITANEVEHDLMIHSIQEGLWSYIPNAHIQKFGKPIIDLILQGGQYFPAFLILPYEISEKKYILPSGDHLTKRQQEVLNYLKQGLSNKQIAGKMNISEPTVKLHIHGLFHKLGATNRTQIILKASELGFI